MWEREERVARIVQKHPELEALSDRDEHRDNSFLETRPSILPSGIDTSHQTHICTRHFDVLLALRKLTFEGKKNSTVWNQPLKVRIWSLGSAGTFESLSALSGHSNG